MRAAFSLLVRVALVRESTEDPQRQTGYVDVIVGDHPIFRISCNEFDKNEHDANIISETLIGGLRSAGLIHDDGELRMNEFPVKDDTGAR